MTADNTPVIRSQSRAIACCWWGLGLVALLTSIYAVGVLAVGVPPALQPSFEVRPGFFYVHIACGGVALILGLLQFHAGLRRRFVQWHRRTGIFYLVMVCMSGSAAFNLSFSTATGSIAGWGFRLLSIFWICATAMAYLRIIKRDITHHREWMIRSYALTLSAVTLRIELIVGLVATGGDFEVVYPVIAFACWIPNWIIAEFWIHFSRRYRQ